MPTRRGINGALLLAALGGWAFLGVTHGWAVHPVHYVHFPGTRGGRDARGPRKPPVAVNREL